MKNIFIKSIAVVALGMSMAACSDFLDQSSPSAMEDKYIFTSEEYMQGAVNNMYVYFTQQNYRARSIWYGYNTDVEYYNSSEKGDSKAELATYGTLPNNDQMNNSNQTDLWTQMYSGVEAANLVIRGIRDLGEVTDVKTRHYLGEALTLRALAYVDLVNMWGDVPARFEPANQDNAIMARTDKDEIYKQVIADLQEAQDLCAWPTELDGVTTTVGRVNKAFVKGLLARVCLYASGYSLHSDGEYRLSTDPELSKAKLYPIALQACKDVMAVEGRYVALKSKFEDIWKDICADIVTAGSESIFEVDYANEPTARGRIAYTFGLRHNDADDMTGLLQGAQVGPTANFFFDYSIYDSRRDVTCCPFEWKKGKQVPNAVNKWDFGKYRFEWMNRYIRTGANDEGINKLYMRYADIVLMRAELENELNGPAAAAPYLQKIRERAFPSNVYNTEVTAYVNAASQSKEAMFNAIVDERAYEFAGEFLRKADLIRWGILKAKLDETKQKMRDLRDLAGDYADLSGHLYYTYETFNWTRNGASNSIANAQLKFYGLNHGETGTPPSGYEEYTNSEGKVTDWIKESQIKDEKIDALYTRDPEKYMYWPIFNVNLNDNQYLQNYSWY